MTTVDPYVCHLCGQRLAGPDARCNSGLHEGPDDPPNRFSGRAVRLSETGFPAVRDVLAEMYGDSPGDTLERAEVRRLMRGTPDGEQGLSGLDASLAVIAKDRDPDPEALMRKGLELVLYAVGFAHGLHTRDFPDYEEVCGHLPAQAMRDGHAHGLRVLPWEMNPAPLEQTAGGEL